MTSRRLAATQVVHLRQAPPRARAGIDRARAGCWCRAAAPSPAAAHRVVPAAPAQQTALQHSGAVHVDVAPHPCSCVDVRVLLPRRHIELLALTGRRRNQVLLRAVGVVEGPQVRRQSRTRARRRRRCVLTQHGGAVQAGDVRRAKGTGCRITRLPQHRQSVRPQVGTEDRHRHRRCRVHWRRWRRGGVRGGHRRTENRRPDHQRTGHRDRGRRSFVRHLEVSTTHRCHTALVTP